MRQRRKTLRSRVPLRGPRLEAAALRELADLGSWSSQTLTWHEFAKRIGVSRQALEAKDAVKDAYHKAKEELKKASGATPEAIVKRTQQQQIESMKARMAEMQAQLDRWVERWVTVERRCREKGIVVDHPLSP
jgi:hypothetical protein